MKKHLCEEAASSEATVVNPPAIQEMNAADKQETPGSSSSPQQNNLQLQPLWKILYLAVINLIFKEEIYYSSRKKKGRNLLLLLLF